MDYQDEKPMNHWAVILIIIGAIALALATSNGQHNQPMVDNTQPNSYTITSSFNDNSVNVCMFYCPEGSR